MHERSQFYHCTIIFASFCLLALHPNPIKAAEILLFLNNPSSFIYLNTAYPIGPHQVMPLLFPR
jgi:hypothetical protein